MNRGYFKMIIYGSWICNWLIILINGILLSNTVMVLVGFNGILETVALYYVRFDNKEGK